MGHEASGIGVAWVGNGKRRLQVELMAQTTNSTCVLYIPLCANGESCQAAQLKGGKVVSTVMETLPLFFPRQLSL